MKIPLQRFVKLLGSSQMQELLDTREAWEMFLDKWAFDDEFAILITITGR